MVADDITGKSSIVSTMSAGSVFGQLHLSYSSPPFFFIRNNNNKFFLMNHLCTGELSILLNISRLIKQTNKKLKKRKKEKKGNALNSIFTIAYNPLQNCNRSQQFVKYNFIHSL